MANTAVGKGQSRTRAAGTQVGNGARAARTANGAAQRAAQNADEALQRLEHALEKAIAAGASDYITKPVDIDQLVAMMRLWLDA